MRGLGVYLGVLGICFIHCFVNICVNGIFVIDLIGLIIDIFVNKLFE